MSRYLVIYYRNSNAGKVELTNENVEKYNREWVTEELKRDPNGDVHLELICPRSSGEKCVDC